MLFLHEFFLNIEAKLAPNNSNLSQIAPKKCTDVSDCTYFSRSYNVIMHNKISKKKHKFDIKVTLSDLQLPLRSNFILLEIAYFNVSIHIRFR